MARVLADLTPLRVSAPYRRLWASLGISNIGQQMTSVAVGLQVWDITHSSFLLFSPPSLCFACLSLCTPPLFQLSILCFQ